MVFEVVKIVLSIGGFFFTLSYNDKFMQPFSTYIFILLGLIFAIDVFYLVFEITKTPETENREELNAYDFKVINAEKIDGKIKKSKKFVIGGTYAIYIITLLVFTAKWSVGVHSHIPMNEVLNAVFVFLLHFLLLGGAFIFFTVMQALVHRPITRYRFKTLITSYAFIPLAVFELIKTTVSLLAFIYLKSSSTKPMTPFSTIMIIFVVTIFIIDVFYFVSEIMQTKKIRENYLDILEETVA